MEIHKSSFSDSLPRIIVNIKHGRDFYTLSQVGGRTSSNDPFEKYPNWSKNVEEMLTTSPICYNYTPKTDSDVKNVLFCSHLADGIVMTIKRNRRSSTPLTKGTRSLSPNSKPNAKSSYTMGSHKPCTGETLFECGGNESVCLYLQLTLSLPTGLVIEFLQETGTSRRMLIKQYYLRPHPRMSDSSLIESFHNSMES